MRGRKNQILSGDLKSKSKADGKLEGGLAMKGFKIAAGVGGIILVGLGLSMAIANPTSEDYEEFAVDRLTLYLKENACKDFREDMGEFLSEHCPQIGKTLIDIGRPQLKEAIAQRTEQRNFVLFSIYQTTISLPTLAPTYEFETVGVLQSFYLYRAQQVRDR